MADQEISLKIPDAKVAIALEGFLKIYPNIEKIPDPEWVDPEDGSLASPVAKYTIQEWVTETIRRNIVRDIRVGLQKKANEGAKVVPDNSIVETI